ncbi:MAG: hypothetical protein J7M21_04670, partial [Planctomycetes bacterium]|nr:hypothetical protein [Planctomycetota bacterium]
SVVVTWRGRRWRLPKGDAAFDGPMPFGPARALREVQTERYLLNAHGTFYEIPRDTGPAEMKPVCTHNRRIVDFCSWRGLLVISGTRGGAEPEGHYFASGDGHVGLWFGCVDDLWRLGRPTGRGGPWRDTPVEPGRPSDPYLMTNYDRKVVCLSHDARQAVTFTIEVDFDHAGWWVYRAVTVRPGRTVTHEFPPGYGAHWVRLWADKRCRATATFVYT